ncbi:MAG: DUF2783 domain-containing protein [Pseudomonadota bacterium]
MTNALETFSIGEDRLLDHRDRFYSALIAAHEGLSDDESQKLNTRLVLMLANAIGDVDMLEDILRSARQYSD